MELEIYTHDKKLVFDILGKSSTHENDEIEIPGNVILIYKGEIIRLSVDFPTILNFLLIFGTSVSASVVAAWLYDKLKGRTEKITINKREVVLNEEEIKRIIEETIKIER